MLIKKVFIEKVGLINELYEPKIKNRNNKPKIAEFNLYSLRYLNCEKKYKVTIKIKKDIKDFERIIRLKKPTPRNNIGKTNNIKKDFEAFFLYSSLSNLI